MGQVRLLLAANTSSLPGLWKSARFGLEMLCTKILFLMV